MIETLAYRTNRAVQELDALLDREWATLRRTGALAVLAGHRGIPEVVVRRLRRGDVLRLETGNGLDPLVTAVVVAFVSAATGEVARLLSAFARDVWTQLLLPRLRRRLGEGAMEADEREAA